MIYLFSGKSEDRQGAPTPPGGQEGEGVPRVEGIHARGAARPAEPAVQVQPGPGLLHAGRQATEVSWNIVERKKGRERL